MVNPQKSACQLRLEARSREYARQRRATCVATSTSSGDEDSDGSDYQAELDAKLRQRIARAAEMRLHQQHARKTHARERVLHAQRVAQEQHAKRREATKNSRRATREKLEVARQRRREKLERLQQLCQRRVQGVLDKVESVKEVQRWREERQRRLLEDQQLDAARRREEQTQRMVRRLSERWQSVESVKDRVQRAKFIQRWYRRQVDARKNAAKLQVVRQDVARIVTSWDEIARVGFEQSMRVMQQRELTRAAQHVLRVLLPAVAAGTPSPSSSPQNSPSPRSSKAASFRVLLMAGMIAFHPDEIMESGRCERLVFAAKFLLHDMHAIGALLDGDNVQALKTAVSRLEARFAFYFDSFSLWKDRDAERLATEMLQSYQEIYASKLRYAAKTIEYEADGLREILAQTEKQLMQLKQALAQVIGRERTQERTVEIEEALQRQADEAEREAEDVDIEDATTEDTVDQKDMQLPGPAHAKEDIQRTNEPSSEVMSLLADEKLVHELMLEPGFRFPQAAAHSESLGGRIKQAMVKAFWAQLAQTKDRQALLRQIDDLRQHFAQAFRGQPQIVQLVEGILSEGVWAELLENAAPHLMQMKQRCDAFLQAIKQIEAPARNESTVEFLRSFNQRFDHALRGDDGVDAAFQLLVDFLSFSTEKVEEVRVDLANVHLGALAAYLARQGSDYEKKLVQRKLAGGFSLANTEKWLEGEFTSFWKQLDEAARDRMQQGDSIVYTQFFRRCVMSLVLVHVEGKTAWPESFQLDMDRLRQARDAMDRVTIVAGMLVLLQEFLARERANAPREVFARLSSDLMVLLSSQGVSGSNLIAQVLATARSASNIQDGTELTALEQRLSGLLSPDSAIFKLLFSRVSNAVSSVVVGGSRCVEAHPSLAAFTNELQGAADSVQRLAKHNESVYAAEYNRMVHALLDKNGA
ncbi:TPA: hypothetical protein N0F65_011320 [Lagenidium giganteum]|uniref:Uncharacterized protein n=1 Tax=Lagenidium giganteum TaxID=4803 RepID=A0AAV2YBR0_9STRA|nr:TPA: hypothetical protein N0F65_011320 [Lagenidium giganteum]